MPKRHTVAQGDCISSIAVAHGMKPEDLWNAPENEALRQTRPHGHALAPRDVVVIPDLAEATFEGKALDRRHKFVRKGIPERLRLVLQDEDGKPRADLDYQLELPDESLIEGKTGADGVIEADLDPRVRRATLRVGAPDFAEVHELQLGGVDPVTTPSGLQHRLQNLGYGCESSGELDDATRGALAEFQSDAGIEITGECCDRTKAALEERYGS
jgi:hypothetical protein